MTSNLKPQEENTSSFSTTLALSMKLTELQYTMISKIQF